MKDDELAEEYVMNHAKEAIQEQIPYFKFAEQMFLAGLKAGRPKWHKVADGDLPKDENDVLVYSGEDWRLCVGRYSPKYKAWETGCDTIAWCEIPKYTEE